MLNFLKRLFQRVKATSPDGTPTHPAAFAGVSPPGSVRRRGEEQFSHLVAGVRDYAIFILDREGNVASWNAGAERIKGYRAEEIVGQHFSRFYPEDVVASGLPARELKEAAANGRFEDEGWRLRKDGTRFWANVVITALRDPSGEPSGFLKITRDLTDRMRAEENARQLLREEASRKGFEAAAEESQRAQREERHQREQLRVTLNSIGDAVIVTDLNGDVTFLNPVAQVLTGWGPEEAAGQPLGQVFRLVNPETRQPVENPAARAVSEGALRTANHVVLISRDGREYPVSVSASPIRGEGGPTAGVVMVFRDVTEARRAVEARMHLAAIVESSDDAIISKTLDGTIASWNKAAERLYGYSAEEAIGKPLSLLVPPSHADELPGIMDRLMRGERVEHFETVRVRKDGSQFDVSLTISPVRNAEGKIIGASKVARDITARKRYEAGLRFLAEASKQLADLLDVPSTLQKVASLAVPQFADWCAVDMLGPEDAITRVAVSHTDPSQAELVRELARRLPPGVGGPLDVRALLSSGKSRLVAEVSEALLSETARDERAHAILRELGVRSCMAVPLMVRGKAQGALVFVVSERQYGVDDLRLAEDLAHRTAIAIENARLYGDLKEADRRKDEFLAMLAHELRNPLAPIRNALQIMKMPGADREAIEYAREMTERQVDQLVRLVDDLLDVSRVMRDRIELRKERVELASVLTRAVETAQPVLDARGQQLILSATSEPVFLHADLARLTQVIGNLLNNAAKFSNRAGRVWLSAERHGDEAVVRVKDEGAGIAPDLLPHVFELFVQGDRTLERSRGGLGIGLTVVRRLVEMHGGTVAAHSQGAGHGSEFVIRLPVLREAPGYAPAVSPTQRLPVVSRRVLVVDDNVDAAESLARILKFWGHEVRIAHTGLEGLRVAKEFCPEVIVLDIGLPEMSGYEVARRLRELPAFQAALLVAVTGYGQEADRRRSLEAGFDHHLTKPVEPGKLQTVLAGLTGRAPAS